jgi:signal transduction histidine kinase
LNRKAEIKVSVSYNQSAVEHPVEIRVADNGAGIPEEQLATIFEPYFTTKSTGTGLGLAMVKQIVESHGGEIRVEKTGASGTVMLVTLPIA